MDEIFDVIYILGYSMQKGNSICNKDMNGLK